VQRHSGFLHQIWKILADLKVVWQAKKYFWWAPNFWRICLILHGLVYVWRIWQILAVLESISKTTFFSLFLAFFGIYYLPVLQK
jgi:hypothetical protein